MKYKQEIKICSVELSCVIKYELINNEFLNENGKIKDNLKFNISNPKFKIFKRDKG